jgi:hypothetical protein
MTPIQAKIYPRQKLFQEIPTAGKIAQAKIVPGNSYRRQNCPYF